MWGPGMHQWCCGQGLEAVPGCHRHQVSGLSDLPWFPGSALLFLLHLGLVRDTAAQVCCPEARGGRRPASPSAQEHPGPAGNTTLVRE